MIVRSTGATGTSDHWLTAIGAAGVPAGPVRDLATALAHPVTVERGLVREVPGARLPGLAQLRLSLDPDGRCPVREPPLVGEHTEEVLAEVGLTAGRAQGAASMRP
jgi:crotonobetainyl-CoA:carnitine CoA-transferase CaiB-like acyl-CoA transferase